MIERLIDRRGFDRFDWLFVSVILGILAVGVASIYSVTHFQQGAGIPLYLKQMLWIMIGAAGFLVMLTVDYHRLAAFAYSIYAGILVILAVVLVVGKTSRGAQRWIPIGPFALQPSEFAKLALIMVLASYFSKTTREGWLQRIVVPALIMAPGLLLLLKQPDLGSGLSFLAIFATVVVVVGIRSKALGVLLLFALMVFPFAAEKLWGHLNNYKRQRIMTFIDPAVDPGGKGYHGLQSRIAIGSGELLGKGFYGGTQSQLKFLPEGHTDFVFAVYAEEWGFLGVLALLGLFMALLLLAFDVAAKAKDVLGLLLAAGIIGMLGFCIVINIGMTAGMFPIVGIPLPLMSYGGSATIMTLAALGLLLNIKRRRLTLFY